MPAMLRPEQVFDGYRLIRPIGSGGFGQVWLCQSEALGDYRALKFVAATGSSHLEREFDALCRYRAAAGRLRSPFILPIEHVNRTPEGLFYIMPVCDGIGTAEITAAEWRPLTLEARIEARRSADAWFSIEEIRQGITPILRALQLLADNGLVHRDVKPDNILFLHGTPCLGDISLLGADRSSLTRRGTPGYSAPSWFLESGGHPDMYGAAMTLYALLTGNPPDKVGRAAFRWPPQGEHSLAPAVRKHWLTLHRLIVRAVDERPGERFFDFAQFERAIIELDEGKWGRRGGVSAAVRTALGRPVLRRIAAGFLVACAGSLVIGAGRVREFAQDRLERFIFPDSHPLSRHSRDCNLRMGEFRGDVANASLGISSINNPFFSLQLGRVESELNSLPRANPNAVPAKLAAILKMLESVNESHSARATEQILEIKNAAEAIPKDCGSEVEGEARESIQRLELDLRKNETLRSEKIKSVSSKIEKLMTEERWSILADILDAAQKLAQ